MALWALIAVCAASWFSLTSMREMAAMRRLCSSASRSISTDQNDAPITEAAFKGHPTALFFGFTHCPEVCPTTLFEMAGWLKTLGDEGKDLRVFFISVDPERDTPDVMKGYTSAFTDRITGITGNPQEVEKLLKGWKIYAKKVPTENGDYTMDHTASVMLLDRDGRLKSTIDYKESPDVALKKLTAADRRMKRAITILLRASVRRGRICSFAG